MNQVRTHATTNPVQIPAELLRSIPRDYRLTGMGKFVVGAALALGLGAVASSVAIYISAKETSALKREMAEQGQVVPGVVVKTYRTGDDGKRDVFLYEFSVDGTAYRGRTDIELRASPHYEAGSSIPVRYLPSQPAKNWIDGHPPGGVPLFVIPLLGGGLLVGSYAIFRNLRRQEGLVSEGRAALARVMKVTRVRRGEQRKQRAQIGFVLLSGARQEAYIEFGRNAPQADSTIVIVYDRENPRRVLRYPACLVRVEKPGEW